LLFKKYVFKQQRPSPLPCHEFVHHQFSSRMVGIARVVESNQETGVENDHERDLSVR
jgi:hypothetical protein